MVKKDDVIKNTISRLSQAAMALGRFSPTGPKFQQSGIDVPKQIVTGVYKQARPILEYLDPRGYQAERQSFRQGGNLGERKGVSALKAMPGTALNIVGASKLRPVSTAFSGALGGVFNKMQGGSFEEGVESGLQAAPSIGGITAFSNPIISKGVSALTSKFASPVSSFVTNRIATGAANIPEGIAIRKQMGGGQYSPQDALLDFGFGALTGSKFPQARIKGFTTRAMHPEDMQEVKDIVDIYRKNPQYALKHYGTDIKRLGARYLDNPSVVGRMSYDDVIKGLIDRANFDYKYPSMGLVDGAPRGEVTKLEKRLDELTGFQKNGDNWKMQYHQRNAFIDNALETAPPEIQKEIRDIQKQLNDLRGINTPEIVTTPGVEVKPDIPGTGMSADEAAVKLGVRPGPDNFKPYKMTPEDVVNSPGLRKTVPSGSYTNIVGADNRLADQNTSLVYHAEPSVPGTKQHDDFKEWSEMVFKDTKNQESKSKNDVLFKIKKSVGESTDKALKQKYVTDPKGKIPRNKAGFAVEQEELKPSETWKDKSRLSLVRETMERNFDDIMGKDAPQFKEKYLAPVKRSEAERQRWLNKEREQIKSLGIKPRSKESAMVQEFGEGNMSYSEIVQLTKSTQKANLIKKVSQVLRNKYDTYLDDINVVLKRNGYDPIPKRKDYFTHFQEVTNILEQIGIPMRDTALPTDVNGLTSNFKPGKNFFSNALPRLGEKTDVDAITGIDRYIDGASKQIFHTDNIQNLRLFEKALRAKYAGTKHLTNFAVELDDYVNMLAGKKSEIDRGAERLLGRGMYAAINFLKKRTGANMIGANISSAITNFIPLTQSLATTPKIASTKGMLQAMSNVFKDDGFIDRSDFLTRRFGSDKLSMTAWEKAGDKASWLFKTVDSFVSQTIVRGKYNEMVNKGFSPAQAMAKADDWAAKVMADRSHGSIPSLFNSQTLGLLTQFQLEVNNQLSFMAKDIPRNFNKLGAASALGQLFVFSYIFNNLYEMGMGRRPAFDPIGVAQQAIEDYSNEDMKEGQATKNLVKNVAHQLPFASTVTDGGRIPLSAALPDVGKLVSGESTWDKELMKPATYILPPFGGGQVKKSVEGLLAFNKGYSESNKERVRYPIPQTSANLVRAGLFGQYSTPEARNYFRMGDTVLGEKQSEYIKRSGNKEGDYNKIIQARGNNKDTEKIKEQLKKEGGTASIEGKELYYDEENETVKSINWGKVASMPESSNAQQIKKQEESYKLVDDVLDSSLPDEKKAEIIQNLGISQEDAGYYLMANESEQVRMGYIQDMAQVTRDRGTFLKTLAAGRKEVNGKMLITNGIVDEMYNAGLITSDEKKALKSTIYKNGVPVVKVSGRGKGAKIKKISIKPRQSGHLKAQLKSSSKMPQIKLPQVKKMQAKIPQIYQFPKAL